MITIQTNLFIPELETIFYSGEEIGEIEYLPSQKLFKVTSITGLQTHTDDKGRAISYLKQISAKTTQPKLF